MPLPPLRNIDVAAVTHEGETMVCVFDPEGYVSDQLLMSPSAFYIATLLDGLNDVSDIQYAFFNELGKLPSAEEVQSVVEALDSAGFLLTPSFLAVRERTDAEFRSRPVRPAHMAGGSYPGKPDELRAFLDAQFLRDGGPGCAPSPNGSAPVTGLIAPHIDYHRGGHAYAHGYQRLASGERPDLVFVFGVAHAGPPVPFVLTRKHFETPLGTVETDLDAVAALEEACAWDPYEHEIVHRTEHSIELHAIMLAHLFGSGVRMVPILCGSLLDEEAESIAIRPDAEAFLARCRQLVDQPGRRACVIAAADLAHVGNRFGDSFDIDDRIVAQVERRDREDLARAAAVDPGGFYRSVMQDRNARRVCGLNCIYATLRTLEGRAAPGELLQYGYAHDPTGGIVSFANVVFT